MKSKTRIGILLMLFFFPLISFASSGNEFEIKDISYDYDLINDNDHVNCKGSLKITIKTDLEMKNVLVGRTQQLFGGATDTSNLRFLLWQDFNDIEKNEYGNIVVETHSEIYWNSYFLVIFVSKDDSRCKSEVYSVNSFINKSDLAELEGLANVNTPEYASFKFNVSETELYIQPIENIRFCLINLQGEIIVDKETTDSFSVNLSPYKGDVLIFIVQDKDNHKFVYKFRIK